ncbi:unnamed protein product [Rhizoctonia solani]|uniref:Uncharacterized protein n=1 Tax=Rhizoctonia solani TaxID=456999 RepID=A0A8H3HXB4_9AGAM|nr:unnamed protein product [Rhizoctonia solani]
MTTVVVTPTFATGSVSYSLYQGNGVNTVSEIASTALPTQLVFDTKAGGTPVGAATTGDLVTMSVSPIMVGTLGKSAVLPTSTSSPPTASPVSQTSRRNVPIIPIILALVAVLFIAMILLFLWYRKRARRRGHTRAGSEEYGRPPAGDVLRKLGTYEKPADPFSDAHASPDSDPFADPPAPVVRPYTHTPSASTGSTKREMEQARKNDMVALHNLARALDQKERQAQAEGRDRRSLPPVELFKAALIR